MSTGQPTDPRFDATGPGPAWPGPSSSGEPFDVGPNGGGAFGGDEQSADAQLIAQTKNQIRQLVHEIGQLAQADITLDEFHGGFLTRVVAAMASFGGAIWTVDDDHSVQLQYQIQLPKTGLGESRDNELRHRLLLKKVLASGQPLVVPPHAGAPGDDEAGNPTDFLLVLAPFHLEQQVQGLIEIFQRPGAGPTTQRGYQRFVVQMSEIVGDFLKNRRLRHFAERQELWEKIEHFTRAVYRGLDVRQTAFTIANDGRQLIQCDRLSVALVRGRRCPVEVVSGLDAIDRRAEEVARLSELTSAVVAARRPLWFSQETRDLPPQIEERLHAYVDRSHAKMIAVVPLFAPATPGEANGSAAGSTSGPSAGRSADAEPLGALVIEQLADDRISESLRHRVEAVVLHSSAALANATTYNRLFLLPLWRALGRARVVNQARGLPRSLVIAASVAVALTALCLTPAELRIASRGKLQPAERRELFARIDGVVVDVPVEHGQMVEPRQLLARLRSDELDNEILTLLERQSTTKEQIASKQRALISTKGLNLADENAIAGDLAQLTQAAESIEKQLALFREKQQHLELRAEQRGQVVTWQVREQLLQRPVQRGQILMSVADPDGPWEIELYVPERQMGHVARAAQRSTTAGEGLRATFQLSTHPDQEFEGRVVEIQRSAEVRGEDGNTVLVRVAFDKSSLPELHSETTVRARIECGARSMGFVLFRDVIETVRNWILFYG